MGKWDFSQAFPYWKLEKGVPFTKDSAFTKLEDVLSFPKIIIKKDALFNINNGQPITKKEVLDIELPNQEISNIFQIITPEKKLVAVYSNNKYGNIKTNEFKLYPLRVFHESETD